MDRYEGTAIQKQILRRLREFYPIRVDEIVLVSSVQKEMKDAAADTVSKEIRELRDKGLIEETIVRTPFGKADSYRFKISPTGIEYLQSLEVREPLSPEISANEIEARLVETYDRIKADMESMRQNLENSQKVLEGDMAKMRQSITDHDQVIRTYFVRVIETFGVFVGIFAVVVVAIIGSLNIADIAAKDAVGFSIIVLVALPIILVVVIVTLLYAIRELVLKMPRTPRD